MAERFPGFLPPFLPTDWDALRQYSASLPPSKAELDRIAAARAEADRRAKTSPVTRAAATAVAIPAVLGSAAVKSVAEAATLPGRAVRREIGRADEIPPDEAIGEAMNFAGSVTLGSMGASRPKGSVGMGAHEAGKAFEGATPAPKATHVNLNDLPGHLEPTLYGSPLDVTNGGQLYHFALAMNKGDPAKAVKSIADVMKKVQPDDDVLAVAGLTDAMALAKHDAKLGIVQSGLDGVGFTSEKFGKKQTITNFKEIADELEKGKSWKEIWAKTDKTDGDGGPIYLDPNGWVAHEDSFLEAVGKKSNMAEYLQPGVHVYDIDSGEVFAPGSKGYERAVEKVMKVGGDEASWFADAGGKTLPADKIFKEDTALGAELKTVWENAWEGDPWKAAKDNLNKKFESSIDAELGFGTWEPEPEVKAPPVGPGTTVVGGGKTLITDEIFAPAPPKSTYAQHLKPGTSFEVWNKDILNYEKIMPDNPLFDETAKKFLSGDLNVVPNHPDIWNTSDVINGPKELQKGWEAAVNNLTPWPLDEVMGKLGGASSTGGASPTVAKAAAPTSVPNPFPAQPPLKVVDNKGNSWVPGQEGFEEKLIQGMSKNVGNGLDILNSQGNWASYEDIFGKEIAEKFKNTAMVNGGGLLELPMTQKFFAEHKPSWGAPSAAPPPAPTIASAPPSAWTPAPPTSAPSKLPAQLAFWDGNAFESIQPGAPAYKGIEEELFKTGKLPPGFAPITVDGDMVVNLDKVLAKAKDGVPGEKLYLTLENGAKVGGMKPQTADAKASHPPEEVNPAAFTGLPMDEASRLKRAKDQGYSEVELYHGMPKYNSRRWDGLGFNPAETKNEAGLFLTDKPHIAEKYAGGAGSGNNTMKVRVRTENPLVVDMKGKNYDPAWMISTINDAWAKGHDFVEIRNMYDMGGLQTQYVPKTPQQVRSVNAVFDPAHRESRNLLRSAVPGALAAPLVLNELLRKKTEDEQ
jgi:hypothetical protein